MAVDINVADVVSELGDYIVQGQEEVRSWVYMENELVPHTTAITRVNGEFPAYQDVANHVVQEFVDVWNELGEAVFKVKKLEIFRHKVNFPITPSKVLNTWLAFLRTEGLSNTEMPISRYIMEKVLAPKVKDDMNILSGQGQYTPGTGLFGDSMDGLITIFTDLLATGNPFKVPVPALTATNIVDVVTVFEEMLPARADKSVMKIFMSRKNFLRYKKRYRAQYGDNNDYSKGQTTMTWLGERELVPLSCLDGSDFIFATTEGNFLRLIDIFDEPRITDIQPFDYKVKVFMEWVYALNFWCVELLFLSDTGGLVRGLPSQHTLFYPECPTDVIAP
jgi:hypothetical protein